MPALGFDVARTPSSGERSGLISGVMPTTTVGSAPSRDRALDALRGWAIVLMILSHVGSHTPLCTLAHLPVWVSAADPFVVLSGIVLGMRARRGPVASLERRTFQLYRAHLVMMIAIILIHETTGTLRVPSVRDAGGWPAVAWMVPALRLQSLDFANILPLFIVFFAVSPVLIAAMNRGFTTGILVVSIGLWAFAQRFPEWLRFTDPVSGPQAFVLFGWQLAFAIALVVGYHTRELAAFWSKHRATLFPGVALVVGGTFALAQLQRNVFGRFAVRLPERDVWWFSKETWGPGRVVYDLGLMLLGYVALSWLQSRPRSRPVQASFDGLEVLGKNSLYCFFAHTPFALAASALHVEAFPMVLQQVGVIAVIAVVYAMARYGVLRRYIPS